MNENTMNYLYNKYIVIKRSKLADSFIGTTFEDKIKFYQFYQTLNDIMDKIGHSYFVLNLDESEAVKAMEYYFHLKNEKSN